MDGQQQKPKECIDEIGRMVNEGLSNGVIVPKYTETHSRLKEKEDSLSRSEEK